MKFSKEHFTFEDEIAYGEIVSQIDKNEPITFGLPINVLLITNRLYGCAEGLAEYLQNSSDITVDLANNPDEAIKIILEKPIKFLIFIGYLKDIRTYALAKFFKRVNKYSNTILYSDITAYTMSVGIEHGIDYVFNRLCPVDSFFDSLQNKHYKQTFKLLNDYPKAAPEQAGEIRKQVRMEALSEINHGKNKDLAGALKRFIK